MGVILPHLPFPAAVRTHALHHGVLGAQVLVVTLGIGIGSGCLKGKTFHKGDPPFQGGVNVGLEALSLLVTGIIDGGEGAYQETLVVLDGTGIVAVVSLREIRVHLDHLAGN